jgi:hypothetical protein
MTEPIAEQAGALTELQQLMARLSLADSQALATVAEVREELARGWLSGSESVPAEIMVMLRGLVVIHNGPVARHLDGFGR